MRARNLGFIRKLADDDVRAAVDRLIDDLSCRTIDEATAGNGLCGPGHVLPGPKPSLSCVFEGLSVGVLFGLSVVSFGLVLGAQIGTGAQAGFIRKLADDDARAAVYGLIDDLCRVSIDHDLA